MLQDKRPSSPQLEYQAAQPTADGGRQQAPAPMRVLARRLAFVVFLLVLTIPWVVLGLFAARFQDRTLSEALAGGRGVVVLLILGAGIAGVFWGKDAWSVVDQALFRDHPLAQLVGEGPPSTMRLERPELPPKPPPERSTTGDHGRQTANECLGCGRVFHPRKRQCTVCEQPLQPAPVPYTLPRKLRFDERIGIGGMAVVYRATDLTLGRSVAVKTLPRISPAAGTRLRREARAAAAVIHPGLASIFSVETWQGMPLLVQELLDGTLADRIVAGALQPREVVDTGIAVAQALHALHRAGILHRDVKPSNIGFARDGTPKLLDFGIARVTSDLRRSSQLLHPSTQELIAASTADTTVTWMGSSQEVSQSDQLVGTLSYLPPEALESSEPSPSYDLWALSVVLYEALTGANLFYGGSPDQLVHRILTADVPDIRSRRPSCPESLAAFFDWSLDRDPDERPQDGALFAQALTAVRRDLAPERKA